MSRSPADHPDLRRRRKLSIIRRLPALPRWRSAVLGFSKLFLEHPPPEAIENFKGGRPTKRGLTRACREPRVCRPRTQHRWGLHTGAGSTIKGTLGGQDYGSFMGHRDRRSRMQVARPTVHKADINRACALYSRELTLAPSLDPLLAGRRASQRTAHVSPPFSAM